MCLSGRNIQKFTNGSCMIYEVKPSLNWADWLYYDETSASCLRWKIEIRRGKGGEVVCVSAHDQAGYLDSNGYWVVGVDGNIYKGHRIVWELHNPPLLAEEFIDHKFGDSTNNKISDLRVVDRPTNQRNRGIGKNNKTGVVGVILRDDKTNYHFRAKWHGLDGKRYEKVFNIRKYGYEEAFRLACEHRTKMIEELNEQGAGYSIRHGT